LAALLAVALVVPAAADEPEQQPAPEPKPTPVPGSLAAAAAGLKLQPAAEGSSSLVITDQNLRAQGAGAAVSQGSSPGAAAVTPPAAQAAGAPVAQPAPAAGGDLASQLLAQQARVDELETRLHAMDEQLAEPSPDPRYPKTNNAPQFRAPGVVDPAQGERDAVARELEAARARLAELQAQGDKAGIRVRKVTNDSAPSAP
jgi:hypothetical protein